MTAEDYERALGRLPKWMFGLSIIGAILGFRYAGLAGAAGFLLGAVAAWFNLLLVEKGVNRLVRLVASEPAKGRTSSGVRMYIQFAVFAALAFVILRFSGFNLKAALLGFLVCPAAVVVEIAYELFNFSH